MTTTPLPQSEIVKLATFGSFYNRFDELLAESTAMTLYFIHSRRWRENHDANIKDFLRRGGSLEVFLPDVENHELMFSLVRHFDDGPLIPALIIDAYRYFARLAGEFLQPAQIWLFNRYPTYSFYRFDQRAVVAMYSNSVAKKELPALEITNSGLMGRFLEADIEDLKKECRRRGPAELEPVIRQAPTSPGTWDPDTSLE